MKTQNQNQNRKQKQKQNQNQNQKENLKENNQEKISVFSENGKTKIEGNEKIEPIEFKEKIEVITEKSEPEKIETRGRKKGGKNKTPSADFSGLKIASSLMSIVIPRLPNPVPLTESEIELVDKTAEKVINKYADLNDFKYMDEIILSITLLGIIYPRLKK